MVRRIDDFIEEWAFESESTSKVIAGTHRSVARTAGLARRAHGRHAGVAPCADDSRYALARRAGGDRTCRARATRLGVVTSGPPTIAPSRPRRDAIASTWTDASLEEMRDMYGRPWKNGTTLRALISHQAHHRGQLTVLMRQAGLRVPGIYGPAREDWASMGMKAEA